MWAGIIRRVTVVGATLAFVMGASTGAAHAAKKVDACTIVPQAKLEAAFGNTFDTPEDTTFGQFKASCRFPSSDINGSDLNMFLTNDVKGGIKDSIGAYFATKKSFQKIYGVANPVKGIGKEAYSAFDDASSTKQGSLLVLDGKNHAALVLATGNGLTADDALAREQAVAKLVLAKLK